MTQAFFSLPPTVQALLMIFGAAGLLLAPFLLLGSGQRITGRAVLGTFVALFGVIIVVNVFMAYKAIGTFPGLEVKNSYVASQNFDADRAAQVALGWTVEHDYRDGVMSFVLRDSHGMPAPVKTFTATVGRTTHMREDVTPEWFYEGGTFTAPIALAPGNWLIHLEATAPDGTAFRQRFDFTVKDQAKG